MCRIAGLLNRAFPQQKILEEVKLMCQLQRHGGPDDEGFYSNEENHLVLGHRRLSLIDLSAAGHQPMQYQNRFYISFNGEIYNYNLLKNDLKLLGHHFKTNSDTEVILAAYSQWGVQSFSRLKGMFAFAIWDSTDCELLLVRDASGIKPLYYYTSASGICFASETRAFDVLTTEKKTNTAWPVHLMAYGHLPEPVTTVNGIQPLPKGCFIKYKPAGNRLSLQSFKHFSFSCGPVALKDAPGILQKSLRTAVERHLISDAPIGVFLSGGIDSSILFLLCAEQKRQDLNSLSLYFREGQYSEKQYQDILLQKINCTRNQHLLEPSEFFEALPVILQQMDLPSCDGINTWFISKYAKQLGLKAVLSGIGADELLGGYPSFKRIPLALWLQKMGGGVLSSGSYVSRGKYKRLSYLKMDGIKGIYLFLRGQFTPHEIAIQLDASEKEVWDILNDTPALPDIGCLEKQNQASWMETNLYMQNQLLRDADVMSMAHGIEIRVPYLDDDFVSLCISLHSSIKYNTVKPKHLLIKSFEAQLPEAIWNRPKMGFSFPFTEWFAQSGWVKDTVQTGSTQLQSGYQKFLKAQLHWSQLLSLIIINNRLHAN